jgi:hypothetical protein
MALTLKLEHKAVALSLISIGPDKEAFPEAASRGNSTTVIGPTTGKLTPIAVVFSLQTHEAARGFAIASKIGSDETGVCFP